MPSPNYIIRAGFSVGSWGELAANYTWTQLTAEFTWEELAAGPVDVADDVLRIVINRTRGGALDGLQVGQADIMVDNARGIYSPTNSLSPYYGRMNAETVLTIKARTDAGSLYSLFSGHIDRFNAQP